MIDTSKYIGIPYLDHGRTTAGVDCWGLVWLIYKNEFDITLPAWSAEYETANRAGYRKLKENSIFFDGWKEVDKPEFGNVGLFEVGGNFHTGLCLDGRLSLILHIMKGSNVTTERVDSILWRNRIRGWWAHVG